ncbi:MAG: hypothetical protein ACLQIB_37165 [Isosphaeraceae bacterium]
MSIQTVSDPNEPIGEILKAAGSEGIVLEYAGQGPYALLPLDDDVMDLLIERSPRFRADCHEIRQRMRSGKFHTQEDVRRELVGE